MTTKQDNRVTKDEWWSICFALEQHIEQMQKWVDNGQALSHTEQTLKENMELMTKLVNSKLSERDKWRCFPDWAE